MTTQTLELLGRAMTLLKTARSIHEEGSEESCGFEYAKQVFLDELANIGVTGVTRNDEPYDRDGYTSGSDGF